MSLSNSNLFDSIHTAISQIRNHALTLEISSQTLIISNLDTITTSLNKLDPRPSANESTDSTAINVNDVVNKVVNKMGLNEFESVLNDVQTTPQPSPNAITNDGGEQPKQPKHPTTHQPPRLFRRDH